MEKQPILLHTKKFDILWEDMDAYGHVNNSQYFT
jgi:acyl-CoA thioesterase FadM